MVFQPSGLFLYPPPFQGFYREYLHLLCIKKFLTFGKPGKFNSFEYLFPMFYGKNNRSV
jgi:hypothetical protein